VRATTRSLTWLLLAAAFAVRLPGVFHDFWLDEVWSYQLVRDFVASPLDIVTRLHIDNNHPLNSLFLYALGDQPAWLVYRIPALIMGTASVALAGSIMLRRGRPHAVAAMVLIVFSYPLIVYSSEARGYAPMIFFALLAIDAHDRYIAGDGWIALATFWMAAVLGFLSHLTFVHAYAAVVLWTAKVELARSRTAGLALARTARCHAVPVIFLAAYYLVYIRHLRIAGAEPASLSSVIGETMALTAGVPGQGVWAWMAAGFVMIVFVGASRLIRKTEPALFILFLAGIVLIPGAMVLVESRNALMPPRFFPRYFLVSITLLLMLGGWLAGEYYQRGGARRLVAAVFLIFWTAGNLDEAGAFFRYGRGHYREAVDDMAHATGNAEIRVSSNSDFRTSTLLQFYRRYLPEGRTLVYYPRGSGQHPKADWRIIEDLEPNISPSGEVEDGLGTRFRLVKRLPFYGLSGCQWSLYQRIPSLDLSTPTRQTP
jgi:hypothetical protein